jgi:hypothetical protein
MTRRILGLSNFSLRRYFFCVAVVVVLPGVFEKTGGWCGVLCGENVVRCVANAGQLTSVKSVRKMGQGFRLYFSLR